ncbi:MAG: glucose-6-phosphate dehydrogenase [Chryseosolibacter sp.]
MDKYKNRYRIAPARAQWWDYGWDAAYFITICIRNRECLFGEVRDKKMILSDLGKIADTSWNDIPNHAKNITLGPSVTMPNHVHGICILTGNQVPFKFVETRHALSLRIDTGDPPITVGQMRSRNPG